MKTKIIEIKAPTYYGNAKCWAMGVCIDLEDRQGYKVVSVEPVANEKNELVSIKVEVEDK